MQRPLLFGVCLALCTVLCADVTFAQDPPPAPANLTATATAPGQVTLTWADSPGATSYRVYRDYNPFVLTLAGLNTFFRIVPSVATVSSEPSYVDTGLTSLVGVHYAVTAVNADGESCPGAPTVVMTTAAPDAAIWGLADVHKAKTAGSTFPNPDLNFRFDPTLGTTGGYIFNLSTRGLGTGTYALSFIASGDPTTHTAMFQVK